MRLSDFDYHLPEELIAQTPCEPRDHARLMVLDRGRRTAADRRFDDLPDYIRPGDTLVFNDTKVIPARLSGVKAGGGAKVEVFLLNRLSGAEWEALVRPGKRVRVGARIVFGEELACEVLADTDFGGRRIRFAYAGVFEEILDRLGQTPLPPYIKEPLRDKDRYQTVYARARGSAAAPTAGLHFTPGLLERLRSRRARLAFVTLHVGLGTFRPVNAAVIERHVMHKEYYSITPAAADAVNAARRGGGRVIAVGTTAIRTLESAGLPSGEVKAQSGWTDIFIYPGYRFKVIDALITNFHLPKSTLLMLVSAFAGREFVMDAYARAVAARYRFFSFGDAMLIEGGEAARPRI